MPGNFCVTLVCVLMLMPFFFQIFNAKIDAVCDY
jgi:hypothetical protein